MRYNETGGQVAYALDQSKTNLNTVAAILNTTLQEIRIAKDLVGMSNEKRDHLDAREKQILFALRVVVKNPANSLWGDPQVESVAPLKGPKGVRTVRQGAGASALASRPHGRKLWAVSSQWLAVLNSTSAWPSQGSSSKTTKSSTLMAS